MKKYIAVSVLVLMTAGCAQMNTMTQDPISTNDIAAKIKTGKTTRQQVINLLGNPDSDNIVNGQETLSYTLSNDVAKAGKMASMTSSVMAYIPGVSAYSGYASQASSGSGALGHSKQVTVTLKNDRVSSYSVTGS
ncbi:MULTISPECIES: outer membrane protein assembly factor BamE [unclassified Tatumella]|uniref:outer membrane protein assembly factor BamE domain-containing protein n=1 Tax=unclassified Tatumella TaxID=2649542 RepID=UPI001BAE58B7|nr:MULTISPECIES: outer membrane protein assembly factor BamE [unclassified Tatumella]MBS0878707.1 outer membrane protein assembly factor BamE [Tatumella sp. JGM82]MBS0891877.1 outer membrane protein assembly factor BamE [Tatumella sp. JGM94]MBS0903300.1 outer membrane protein assembly factor BamE [Tatumella sp. JGM100]